MLLDDTVKTTARVNCEALEQQLQGDVAFYYGPIEVGALKMFRDFMEKSRLVSTCGGKLLFFFLNSPGGSAEAAEKMVEIMRHHYSEVAFFVPDMAFSAGTILCMSGDHIYMDYSSALGPIDPQVWNGKE
jgi:membrane-bound ClpP family serine protease